MEAEDLRTLQKPLKDAYRSAARHAARAGPAPGHSGSRRPGITA